MFSVLFSLLPACACIGVCPAAAYSGYNSPSKEISAKDIVSSIISAANKKMQKAKTRRGLRLNSDDTTDSREEEKVVRLLNKK
jgi:hypothetical protein